MSRVPMTSTGAQRLREELQQLKSVERPRIIAAIAEARAHGDLKENAEYHAAKEQQAFVEGRIADFEDKLSRAQIIDPKTPGGRKKQLVTALARGFGVDWWRLQTGQTTPGKLGLVMNPATMVSAPAAGDEEGCD